MQIDRMPPAFGDAKDNFMVFTAADGKYLERFLRPFVGSMMAFVPHPCLHIHLYNPQQKDFDLLSAVTNEHPDLQLSWSHENFSAGDLERGSGASPKQSWESLYICCSRFLAARAIQLETGANLLITDIDILFNGDVRARFNGGIECALRLRPLERNLCRRTLGGVVFVSSGPTGRKFLTTTCDYIERFLTAGFYWFYYDQYALHRAVQSLSKQERRELFSELTPQDVSFKLAKDGLILFPKGKLKDGDSFIDLAKKFGGKTEVP